MRPHTVQTNMQWNLCGNTPRYPMWFKRSVATHLVSQHGAKTCGRTPRVVLSTCSTEIQQFSLSSFCWAMLVGCKCGEGCLDKIVTAQKGVLGINVGQIREASLDVPVSCVQCRRPPVPLLESEHLLRTDVRASLATLQPTAWDAKRGHRQLQGLTSAASARRREGLTGDNSRMGAVLSENSTGSNSSAPTRRNAEWLLCEWLRT